MSQVLSFAALAGRLRAGDPEAAARVFRQFGQRLVGLASSRLHHLIRHKAGPEDVVQSVFRSFFARQRQGQFDLRDWDGLWDILVVITLRKCCNRAEYFHAACRDVRRETAAPPDVGDSGTGWEALSREPTPSEAAELAETLERLLGRFEERERAIVELTLQGHAVAEVSARVGCTERKVYRVLEWVKAELRRMQAEPLGQAS